MTVVVTTPTVAEQRQLLQRLARTWASPPHVIQELFLGATVHESMDEPLKLSCTCGRCLTCVWDAYVGDLALADGFEAGTVCWQDIDPDITETDRSGTARSQITSRVEDSEDILLYGWPVPKAVKACA